MKDRLRIVKKVDSMDIAGEYIPPGHIDHPYPEKKGFRKILQKIRLIPSPEDHIIFFNPVAKHKRSYLIQELNYSRHYKNIVNIALTKLKPLKDKDWKPPRRGVLIHEKTHYEQELRSKTTSTLHDGLIIYDYLKTTEYHRKKNLYTDLIFLTILMESESIVNEMKSCNSQEFSVLMLSALLSRISGNKYKSGLYELLERIKDTQRIRPLDPYIIGIILTVLEDDSLFIQLLQGGYELDGTWFNNFEELVLESIEYYLNNPGVYLNSLKNSPNLLNRIISEIDSISKDIREELESILKNENIPNKIRQQLIKGRNSLTNTN